MSQTNESTIEPGSDMYSKEYVEKLKSDLAAKTESEAKLKAFKSTYDQKQRELVEKLQPDVNSYIETLVKENPDYAEDMKPLVDWSRSCHESNTIETVVPLARVMSCASAQFKRTREEASAMSDKAKTLGVTMKELEDIKADNLSKAQRIAELEALCNDRQSANETLQEELAKVGIINERKNFSKISSRETNATDKLTLNNTVNPKSIVATTSNASNGTLVEDQLMGFVYGNAKGNGSGRIVQSNTGHSYLGVTTGGISTEINSAFSTF
jgi:Skp family chaperone for outer membrane proteins